MLHKGRAYLFLLMNIILMRKCYNFSKSSSFDHNDYSLNRIVLSKKNNSNIDFERKINTILQRFDKRDDEYRIGSSGDGIVFKKTDDLNVDEQFQNDIVMIYKTLYPETNQCKNFFSDKEDFFFKLFARRNKDVIFSIKKLLFALADLGLFYGNKENEILNVQNPKNESMWPYPLASSLCHGGRTIFLIEKNNNGSEVIEYFFKKNYELLYNREAASHKVESNSSGFISEKKILVEAAFDWLFSQFNVKYSPHFGMNIPLGGIGNYWSNGEVRVGSQGYGEKGSLGNKVDKDPLQHGHLYVRYDQLDGNYSSMLIGLEEEAPNYKGMFANKVHNFLNALETPSISVCGGAKWSKLESQLGDQIPNNYGGKAVFFDKYPDLKLFEKIGKFNLNLQKKVWWIILSLNAIEYKVFKENYLVLSEKDLENNLKNI